MPATKRKRRNKDVELAPADGTDASNAVEPQTAKELELYGPRPKEAAEIFTVYGTSAYVIRKEQLVPVSHSRFYENWHPDSSVYEHLARSREARYRRPLVINAGKPSPMYGNVGACFHADFGFTPLESDVHELEWRDPKPLQCTMGDTVYCSSADALARYAGGQALADEPDSDALFETLFLNYGEHTRAAPPRCWFDPDSCEGPSEEFERQRNRINNNMLELFFVCPFLAEPVLGANDYPHRLGDRNNQTVSKMMLGCFASIVSDKREGAPARNICGYHDRCRLHILPKRHIERLKEIVGYYRLESWWRGVWDVLEDGQMNLEVLRQRELQKIPFSPQTSQWWEKQSAMLWAKPWVQRCNLAHPQGETRVVAPGTPPVPVLVPLVRGGAEERNGVPWLYLGEGGASNHTDHARAVRDALVRLRGCTPERRRTPAELHEATVLALQNKLAKANAETAEWKGYAEAMLRLCLDSGIEEAQIHRVISSARPTKQ